MNLHETVSVNCTRFEADCMYCHKFVEGFHTRSRSALPQRMECDALTVLLPVYNGHARLIVTMEVSCRLHTGGWPACQELNPNSLKTRSFEVFQVHNYFPLANSHFDLALTQSLCQCQSKFHRTCDRETVFVAAFP